MTSCEKTPAAIVNEVLDLISEEHMRETIEAPLEAAAAKLDLRGKCPAGVSYGEFAVVVTDFITLVYSEGFPCPIRLSRDMACAEAVFLLDRTYQGNCADGFAGAFLDVRDHGDAGLANVLTHTLSAIVSIQKGRHIEAVMTTRVRFLPWETRISLAVFLLENGDFESEYLLRCAPWQLADLCPEMIMSCSKSIRTWKEFLASRPVTGTRAFSEHRDF